MLYGTADKSVPIALTDSFVKALRANDHPDLTYLRFDGVDHSPFWLQWEKYHIPAVEDIGADRSVFRSHAQEWQGPIPLTPTE